MAAEEVKNLIDGAPEGNPDSNEGGNPEGTNFEELLKGVDLNQLLQYDSVKALVQQQSDRRVTQALQTARTKWEAEKAEEQSEAKKLERMTAEQREKYKFEQEKSQFEAERKNFQHAQLVVETQKQLLAAGLPDLAEFITGATAEETTANIGKLTNILCGWKSTQLNAAMRGTTPKDTTPQSKNYLTAAEIRKMTPAEINQAWKDGRIDTTKF